jgi:hypothetical protein
VVAVQWPRRPTSLTWWDASKFARRSLRRLGVLPQQPGLSVLTRFERAVSVPAALRGAVRAALRRTWPVTVPIERLLVGVPMGWARAGLADATAGTPRPPASRSDGPDATSWWLAVRADEAILARGKEQPARRLVDGASDYPAGPNHLGGLVAPIRGSSYYLVLEGHEELARAVARGGTSVRLRAQWLTVTTPLQDLLSRMSWLDGSRELYQPIDSPELQEGWTTVRRCTDRLAKMQTLLTQREVSGSYLDVASCYGWFVAAMDKAGFEACGLERDPLAVPLGQAVYGLREGQVATGDAVEWLASTHQTWNVVSCFSLLHHFVLNKQSVGPEELIKLLDRVTGDVLFLDTGQESEHWFKKRLRGWSPTFIAEFLQEHTTFDQVLDLGPDDDRRPPYVSNYGRHLFACVRDQR